MLRRRSTLRWLDYYDGTGLPIMLYSRTQGWVIPNMRFKRFLKTRFKQVFYFLKQGLAE
jgi:hypothetical protein